MDILKIDRASHEEAYGILCQRLGLGAAMPFGATHCVIEAGGATAPHLHLEREAFWITGGRGRMRVGDETEEVGPGDVALLPPGIEHQLENLADDAELTFLSLYWDPALAAPARPAAALVTAAPPTPNGPLHLGHVSGPYVAADAHARYLRARGVDARYLCGSDDYQSYTATKAAATGEPPEAITRRFGDRNHATLEALGCDLERFLRPVEDAAYRDFVQGFFRDLTARGALELRDAEHLHCATCDRYLHEARVTGTCPRCGEGTSGNGCEACVFVNDCVDLVDPRCASCGATPEIRRAKRYYLDLAAHAPALEAWLATATLSPRIASLAAAELARGLPAISVSHVDGWGIPVPDPACEGQVIYEWLEMAAGYRYAAAALDGPRPFTDAGASVAQFFGVDNAFFYTFFIPAALLAHDPDARLPDALLTNEFYRLEGLKFSTSRNHAVWSDDMLAEVPADLLRFHLARDRPEWEETSFAMADLAGTARDELAAWEAWAGDLHGRVKAAWPEGAPEVGELAEDERRFQARAGTRLAGIAAGYEARGFSLREVARELAAFARDLRDFAAATARLGDAPALAARRARRLALEAGAAEALARAAAPLMPGTARALLAALGREGAAGTWPAAVGPLPAGSRPGPAPGFGFAAAARVLEAKGKA